MKLLTGILLSLGLVFISCSSQNAKTGKKQFNQLEWLIGKWERINDQGERKTFERWKRETDRLYTGIGFTLLEQDTVFKEEIEILEKNDTLNFKVTGPNEKPTYFKFTDQTDSSFVCENKANEFPKKIEYIFSEDIITATISGGGPATSFVFVKQ